MLYITIFKIIYLLLTKLNYEYITNTKTNITILNFNPIHILLIELNFCITIFMNILLITNNY